MFPKAAVPNYPQFEGICPLKIMGAKSMQPKGRAILPLKCLGNNPSLPLPASVAPGVPLPVAAPL